eukprot:TRINITY_DN9892_c4_g1_i1.p1 TRINITY_DN9892_c4_g1~~TRINITY_DN9892_c4_g1_i1.p1  ORF type:complete len:310 (-),score=50.48 TRINITY_DN9892_c4_g1_i1:301-1200(-)
MTSKAQRDSDSKEMLWTPPKHIEELYARTDGNQFQGINQPTAGPRYESELEVGPQGDPSKAANLQLYSLATPNGWKVGILLEELGVPYDAHTINIGLGEQFSSGFVGANPNSKIPALIDKDGPGKKPIALMESGSIMLYLAEKYSPGRFLPLDARLRSECLQWVFWQCAGQGPMTGNFGHFMVYAPAEAVQARNYGVARYGMEVQRLCSVLDLHLAGHGSGTGPRQYLVGDSYTIADMACFPWAFMLWGKGYNRPGQPEVKDFLSLEKYTHLKAWVDRIAVRPEVQRGIRVCSRSRSRM